MFIKCLAYQSYSKKCNLASVYIDDLYTAYDIAYKIINIYGLKSDVHGNTVYIYGADKEKFLGYYNQELLCFELDLTLPFQKYGFSIRRKQKKWIKRLKRDYAPLMRRQMYLQRQAHLLEIGLMSGYEYEEYSARYLESVGYKNVQITPKSRDFGADIIAWDNFGNKCCFQCKKYSKPVGIKAVQEVSSARIHYNCQVAAVLTNSSYTKAARELAQSNNVQLFNLN